MDRPRLAFLIVLFAIFVSMAAVSGVDETEYYTNNSLASTYDGLATTTYHFNHTLPSPTQGYGLSSLVWKTYQYGDTLSAYSVTGTGTATAVVEPRCWVQSYCWLFQGLAGAGVEQPTIEYTNSLDMRNNTASTFVLSFVDVDLEVGERFEVLFFNGATYDSVYLYNGTDNGRTNATWTTAQIVNVSLPISTAYRVQTFRWIMRASLNDVLPSGNVDGIFVTGLRVNDSQTRIFSTPHFYHEEEESVLRNISTEFYMNSTRAGNMTVTLEYFNGSTPDVTFTNTTAFSTGSNNLTVELFEGFKVVTSGVFYRFSLNTTLAPNHNITVFWGDGTPSHAHFDMTETSASLVEYRFDNTTQDPIVYASFNTSDPIVSVRISRNNASLGFMSLCNATTYCFVDSGFPVDVASVEYEFAVTDLVGVVHDFAVSQNNTLPTYLILLLNYDGEFYVDVGETTLFSVSAATTSGTLYPNASLYLDFGVLGLYNLAWDPVTHRYATSLTFSSEGSYPFAVRSNVSLTSLASNYTGIATAGYGFDVCFKLYTDRNSTDPYVNDLMQVIVYPDNSTTQAYAYAELLDLWTDGQAQAFPFDVFHTDYFDGEACVRLYNASRAYRVVAFDGSVEYNDNYDPPRIRAYFGTFLELTQGTLTPETTYSFYMPRLETGFGRLWHDLRPLVILVLLFSISLALAIATGEPLKGIVTFLIVFVSAIAIWGVMEVLLWVFG